MQIRYNNKNYNNNNKGNNKKEPNLLFRIILILFFYPWTHSRFTQKVKKCKTLFIDVVAVVVVVVVVVVVIVDVVVWPSKVR